MLRKHPDQNDKPMLDKIKKNPRLKHFLIGLISSHKNPRPRLWVRWLVNPFVHRKGRGAVVRSRRSRHDLFPWHRFEVGKGALVEQFTVLNNGAGDILIGDGARVGIGSVVIGPVRMGERAGLGQHVFVAGFNHGYADPTRDSNLQPLVVREVVIGPESHIGANSVVVAGVHIGERVQVGAGSVVTKDIPSYCVAAGNPARIIKRYDFRRRRWVRVNESDDQGSSQSQRREDAGNRKKDGRREDKSRPGGPGQSGDAGKPAREQEARNRGGNTPTDNPAKGVSTDRRQQADLTAAGRGQTHSDKRDRNRTRQSAQQPEQGQQQAQQPAQKQPATEKPQPPVSPNHTAGDTAQPARRRRTRRKSVPEVHADTPIAGEAGSVEGVKQPEGSASPDQRTERITVPAPAQESAPESSARTPNDTAGTATPREQ